MHHQQASFNLQKHKKGHPYECPFVIRLGLEPKTPTLKVLCSTS